MDEKNQKNAGDVETRIQVALDELLAMAKMTIVSFKEKEIQTTTGISFKVPLTINGARATIAKIKAYADEHNVNFEQFKHYGKEIEEAINENSKEFTELPKNENGISEYKPTDMNKEKDTSEVGE